MRRWVLAVCLMVFLVLPAGCARPQRPNSPPPLSWPPSDAWERSEREIDAATSPQNRHHRDR